MKTVTIVQYMRPFGHKKRIKTERPDEIVDKAEALQAAGYEIAMEVLTTGQVSMTVGDDKGDYASRISSNGPAVPEKFDSMIEEAAGRLL